MPNLKKFTFQKVRGERLDKFLVASLENFSRAKIQELVLSQNVFVNGKHKKSSELLKRGDVVEVHFSKPKTTAARADRSLPIKVVKEADDYIVVEKPADVVTHPNVTKESKSLIEGVLAKYPEVANVGEDSLRPGIVHRLDRGTSGLVVIARTKKGFESLKKQFKDRTTEKEYVTLVFGNFKEPKGVVMLPIVRSKHNPTQFVAKKEAEISDKNAKGKTRSAITEYEVVKEYGIFTLLRVKIKTGRTHQIRVHMKAISHPVVGDDVYTTKLASKATKPFQLHRFFLHAERLAFDDPKTKKRVVVESKLPKILQEFLHKLS